MLSAISNNVAEIKQESPWFCARAFSNGQFAQNSIAKLTACDKKTHCKQNSTPKHLT